MKKIDKMPRAKWMKMVFQNHKQRCGLFKNNFNCIKMEFKEGLIFLKLFSVKRHQELIQKTF